MPDWSRSGGLGAFQCLGFGILTMSFVAQNENYVAIKSRGGFWALFLRCPLMGVLVLRILPTLSSHGYPTVTGLGKSPSDRIKGS